jgi:vacuolar-type H+-ATPase subunit H
MSYAAPATSALGEPIQAKERPGFFGGVKDVLQGAVEVPATMVSGGAGAVVGGLRGLAGLASGQSLEQAAQTVSETQEALTYQPRSAPGQALTQDIGLGFQQLAKPGEKLASAGYPAAGAAVTTALQGALPLAAPGMLKTGKGIIQEATPAARQAAMKAGGAVKQAAEPYISAAEAATAARRERIMAEAEAPRESMGAALTSTPTEIAAAIANASPELKQIVSNIPINEISKPALVRHIEADSLPKPMRLMGPQATQDVVAISDLYNKRGVPGSGIPEALQQQNKDLIENTDLIRDMVAPDTYSTKKIEASENIIDAYRTFDEGKRQEIRGAYKALEDANGGQFPVDGAAIAQNSLAALAKKLKTDYLSGPIRKQLDAFMSGEPMSFEMFEAMRTNLADEIRTAERAGNGNAAMAASIVRSEMEKLPMTPGTGEQLKGLADTARGLAKARFDMLKKDPAYKAIVKAEDATINEKLPADNFYDKFVLNGKQRQLQTMIDTFGDNSPVHQEIRAATMFHLKERAGIDSNNRGNFTQAGYNKALEALDRTNKLGLIFDPQGQLMTKTLGNVAAHTQFQPRGSFVNNSNTLVGYLGQKAAGALETAANTTFGGMPVGTLARQSLENAAKLKGVQESMSPLAGVRIQRVKGQPKAPTLKDLEKKTSPGMTPKGRGQRGAITLGGVPKTERIGTAPTLSQLPENQKLGQTLVGKKQRGSVGVSKSERNPILISSQRYLDPKIIAEKQKNKDYVVTISPAFEANGETMQVVIDGHHSLAAAKKDGAKPTFVVAKKQNDDRIGLLEKSVDDYLESNYMDSDWYNVKNGDTVF